MTGSDLIPLGKIVGTHGLRGELRVHAYAGESSALLTARSVIIRTPDGKDSALTIVGARLNAKKLLLAVKDVTNINQVLHLVGQELYVSREQLPEPEADEYYWHDLLGLKVITDTGQPLGSLVSIMETGSNDVYLVKGEGREYLIPALADVVVNIDVKAGIIIVSPPDGLLDL
jgi:16S rRNA processing protein RimM